MSRTADIESDRIEPTMRALRQLSPGSQSVVAALVRQLMETGGGFELRETSPRSPTHGLPGPARLKGRVMGFRCHCGYTGIMSH